MNTNYDGIAKLEGLLCDKFDKQVREIGLNVLAPHTGERILEIGYGIGHIPAEIARVVGPNGKAFGFDMSKLGQAGCEDTEFLPHGTNSLDGIVTGYILERFDAPPLPTVLAECKRALRPGGRIVVIGLSRECKQGPEFDPIYTCGMLIAAGFAIKDAQVRKMWAPIEIVLAVKGIACASLPRGT
jgi:ubiquinone/menaquinone biosynthesis C-methylase UbiE